jgi:acyl-coenzyme A synthetase/AMP-(fatty) acid ligase
MTQIPLQFLLDRFAEEPGRAAFVDRDRVTRYGELTAAIAAAEAALAGRGIGPGDVVVVVGDYSPGVVAFLLALARRGAVVTPLSPASVIEREVVLEVSQAGWVVEWRGGLEDAAFTATGRRADHPMLAALSARGAPGLLLFSSGSTGKPKAILHDLARVAEKFRRRSPPMVAITFLMLDHFGGLNTLLSITSVLGTVVTVADRGVDTVCRAIATHRVEILPATPSFLNLLVRADAHRAHDLSSLKRITYGTEVMPQGTLDRLHAAFPGVTLQQTYGLSEVGVLRSRSRQDGSLWMRLGGEGFELTVRDGVLWVRSAYAMEGYLNAPSPFDQDGWFDTQDRVEVDGEWMRVLGRVTDLINVAGQKVYPAEVEEVILGLEGVLDAAVYGERNALLGQVVVARVATARPEPLAALRARVRAACAARLASFKVPQKVLAAAPAELTSSRMKKRRGPATAAVPVAPAAEGEA